MAKSGVGSVLVLLLLLIGIEALDVLQIVRGVNGNDGDVNLPYQMLLDNSVIPDWVDAYGSQVRVKLGVSYEGGIGINPNGVLLCQSQVQAHPHVTISSSSSSSPNLLYTLLLVDPDGLSPEEPNLRNVLHWMVTNIPSSQPQQEQEQGLEIWEWGNEVSTYIGPHIRFGLHRYYFLLFQQEDRIHVPKEEVEKHALRFSVRNFTKAYNLGYPIDGALFLANMNDSCSLMIEI